MNQNCEIPWRHRNWLAANNEWIGTGFGELGSGFKFGPILEFLVLESKEGSCYVNQNHEIPRRHRNWLVANNEWIGTGSSELGSGFKWGESTHP